MNASKISMLSFGAGLCEVTLYLVGLAFFIQALDNLFYTVPYDRLFSLGLALIVVFTLRRTFRAMAKHAERGPRYPASGYTPAMIPLRVRR